MKMDMHSVDGEATKNAIHPHSWTRVYVKTIHVYTTLYVPIETHWVLL